MKENPREAIVIGQKILSIKIAEGADAQVCLGIIAPDAKQLERDRRDLCDPLDARVIDELSHRSRNGIHNPRSIVE